MTNEIHYGDCPRRPGMHGILIPGTRGRLLSVLYTAGGEGPHPTVILLHGIPGCERNLNLAQALRRAGPRSKRSICPRTTSSPTTVYGWRIG